MQFTKNATKEGLLFPTGSHITQYFYITKSATCEYMGMLFCTNNNSKCKFWFLWFACFVPRSLHSAVQLLTAMNFPYAESSKRLWNVGQFLRECKAQQPRIDMDLNRLRETGGDGSCTPSENPAFIALTPKNAIHFTPWNFRDVLWLLKVWIPQLIIMVRVKKWPNLSQWWPSYCTWAAGNNKAGHKGTYFHTNNPNYNTRDEYSR